MLESLNQTIANLPTYNNKAIVSEQMTQGLILLKDMMCWKVQDITFLNQNERKPSLKMGMSSFSRAKLKEWPWAEYIIYVYLLINHQCLLPITTEINEKRTN